MTIWIGKVLPVLAPVYERQSVDKITLDEPILQCFSQVFSITSRLQCGTKYKQINFEYYFNAENFTKITQGLF